MVAMTKISCRITNLFDFMLSSESESELTWELALLISHQLMALSIMSHVGAHSASE